MKRFWTTVLALLIVSAAGRADIKTRPIQYHHDTTTLEGLVVADSAAGGKRPGVLFAHDQGPASPHARSLAGRLARLGYVVLPNLLAYGTAGAAWGHTEVTKTTAAINTTDGLSQFGWAAGAESAGPKATAPAIAERPITKAKPETMSVARTGDLLSSRAR